MVRKKVPSSSGLPDTWDIEMERRLGFLEAWDEASEPKTMVKVLKREFPELSRNVIPPEALLRWIAWLDRQDYARSATYRAGLAAGQSKVLESLKAKGIELEPMDLSRYSKTDGATTTGSQADNGVRLVENDGGVDEDIRVAAGGLEPIINGSNPSNSAKMTHSASQKSMHRARIGNTPGSSSQSRASHSGARPDKDTQIIHDPGIASIQSPSISPMTTQPRSGNTSVSAYFPGSTTNTSFPSAPNTPGVASQQHRSKSIAHGTPSRASKSVKNSPGSTIKRSGTTGSANETPVRTRSGLGISHPSPVQGIRERRQLGELNVGIIPPSLSIQALPDISGKENLQTPTSPSGKSNTSAGLRARMKAKLSRT